MRIFRFSAWLAAIPISAALAQPPAAPNLEANVLLRLGEHVVTEADFRANLERLPEAARKLADASPERNRAMVENLLVARVLAARARDEGMVRDAVTARRLQLQEESFLATQYLAAKRREAKLPPSLEDRARELYVAAPERYRLPERVRLQRILVDLYGRTREMALERALEARARAAAGEDFLALAKEYSDDPSKARNRGDLGFLVQKDIEAEVWTAATTDLSDGQISQPILTKAGYHILKRVAYQPPVQPAFDDLKSILVERERERVRDEAANAAPSEVLGSPQLQWNAAAMEALTRQLSAEEVRRLSDETLKRQPASRRGR